MNLVNELSKVKNYKQLIKLLKPMFKSGDLVLFQTIYNNYCSILHGDNLLVISSDRFNHHSGKVEYITRIDNEKGSYNIIREQSKEDPIRNTGLSDFYDMLTFINLGLDY